MKSYSKFNLLQRTLSKLPEKKTLIDYVFFSSKYRYVEIDIPYYDYLRGTVFLEDFNDLEGELFETQNNTLFKINHLFDLLYVDFIHGIKPGIAQMEALAQSLISRKKKYSKRYFKETRVMRQIKSNLFTFVDQEEEIINEKEKMAIVTLRMKETSILRGEIFLHDLSEYLAEDYIKFEDLLMILYLDFIDEIKDQEKILPYMKYFAEKL